MASTTMIAEMKKQITTVASTLNKQFDEVNEHFI
jgi:hypothetical protein